MIDMSKFAGVRTDHYYDSSFVADLWGRSRDTVRRHCRLGKLDSKPDPFDRRRYLIAGSTILAVAAELLVASTPAASETSREREARGAAALADIRDLIHVPAPG